MTPSVRSVTSATPPPPARIGKQDRRQAHEVMKQKQPRRWKANPMAMFSALNRVTPVKNTGSWNLRMRILAHDAMDVIRQGKATRRHIDIMVQVCNISETLALGYDIGIDWKNEINEAQLSLKALATRSVKIRRYVLRAEELKALNLILEIHDAQLDGCTVDQLNKAREYVTACIARDDVVTLPTFE